MSATVYFKFKKNFGQIFQWSSANVVIDGRETIKVSWTEKSSYTIEPGVHKVQISFPYLGSEAGKANAEFEIKEGEKLLITYKTPLVVLTGGTILIEKC